ncbi:MAG TPA: cytochrome P450 [Caldimonas sp.]|nr:cytochrome P450 [Caldimonas sp.]HEX2542247.1 cytochrome P450 [Caldimonas sp.]
MLSDAEIAARFDLRQLPDAFYDDPFPTYRALREHEPVKRMADGSLFLTRYADIVAVYKDVATFSSDKHEEFLPKYGPTPLYEHHTTSLVFNDPPLHTRVRRLIAGALTPKHVAAMEGRLVDRVEHLLDAMAARGAGVEIDLIESFASAIPVEVIGNLLDVPVAERGPLRDWSLAILGALEPVPTAAQHAAGNEAVAAFLKYLDGLVARRRAAPGDPEVDVLTRLIEGEAGGEKLTPKELLHNCIFLLNAGHETTTNLIGNGLKCLLDAPAEKERLLADPGLMRSAVEEFLRIESSNQLGNRITTGPAEIGGVALAPRTQVTLCIGAANRDPAQFPAPDRLDVGRTPNRHVAFGSGIHQCVGMGLARLEGRIAIGRFLERFPRYELAAPAVRARRARFRGHVRLPCRLSP